MSRIGKKPIPIPSGVEITVENGQVAVKGGKGALAVRLPPRVSVSVEDATIHVARKGDDKVSRAMHGLARANLANAVHGVTEGFTKTLEIVGTGYRAELKGSNLQLQLGYSHPIVFEPPAGVTVACESATKIVVSGYDKVKVGQVAADIRGFRPPEPYKGKGIRYANEHVRRKTGKSAG